MNPIPEGVWDNSSLPDINEEAKFDVQSAAAEQPFVNPEPVTETTSDVFKQTEHSEISRLESRKRSRSRSYDRHRSRHSHRRRHRSRSRSRGRRKRSRSRSRGYRRSSRSRSRSSSYDRHRRRRSRDHRRKRSRSHSRSTRSKSRDRNRRHYRSRRYSRSRDYPNSPKDTFVDNPDLNNVEEEEEEIEPPKENAFKNDGSFLEMFKQMQEQQKADEAAASASANEIKKPAPPPFGKRRGGRVLKTGMVEKTKLADGNSDGASKEPQDAWSIYLKEVKRYKEACCYDDSKTRPLVK